MVQILARSGEAPDSRMARKRIEILEAASRVFRERGLQAAGMREIAAELGMHVGNLYYYFRNKQQLLAFCQLHALEGLLSLAERVRAEPTRADAKLTKLIVGHVVRLNEETPGSLAHLDVEALEPEWRSRIMRQRDRYETAVRELIQEGIDAGIFRSCDAKVSAMAILGALNWTVKWYDAGGDRTCREIGCEFAELMVRGLAVDGEFELALEVRER